MIAQITTEELREKMNHGDRFTLVEVMPREYYEAGHLPHAVNLPPPEAGRLAASLLPDKSAEIVLYCSSHECETAEDVARELDTMGYTNLRIYRDGKEEWVHEGGALDSPIPEQPAAPWQPRR